MFACGQSPICVAVNELVKTGVVVVAAAGNTGFGYQNALERATSAGFPMSINDPGNAEYAITVGSTNSTDSHAYGVSYFSSKGPTADGRLKPDVVAPGERMISCAPPGKAGDVAPALRAARYVEHTGTTSATAFVSGVVAALLSARHELIGRPALVKQLLTSTAEDLNRDRYMQGHGLVNLMRALVESSTVIARSAKPVPIAIVEEAAVAPPTGVLASPPTPSSAAVARAALEPAESEKRFAVAVSYPGERRDYVKKVIWALRDLEMPREKIFYDRFHEAELVGPNLDSRLQRIYHDDSELIVIFISAEYEQKDWCGLEWRAIRDIIKRRQDADVMPLRFDDTDVPGLFSIDGYIDLRKRDPEQVADLINDRLGLNRRRQPQTPPVARSTPPPA
jgi:Subtilase family/TIR domain